MKFTIPEYTLYFDTKAACSKKPPDPVAGELHPALAHARKLAPVDVRIPEVVFEELTHQQFKIADAALVNLRKNARTLREVCGQGEDAAPNSEELIRGIREQFSAAGKKPAITVLAAPVDKSEE